MEEHSSVEVGFRFLSHRSVLRTDVPALAAYCGELFSRFRDDEVRPGTLIEILGTDHGSWRVRDSMLDAEIDRESWLEGIATARLLETAGNEIEDHDLFHGAALSLEDRGLILLGESGFGKSLTSLALLLRGWRFFSDEAAAVEPGGGRLVPFPKAIELRPEAAAMLDLPFPEGPLPRGKALYDAEALAPGCLAAPCPVRSVVFLEEEGTSDAGEAARSGSLRVMIHRRVDGLPAELERLEGVESCAWDGESASFPVLALRYDPERFAAWRLDEPLGAHGVLILDSTAEQMPPAGFDGEPLLQPLPAHAGVARLLARFRGRKALARRLERRPGGFAALFAGYLDRLSAARFFRLTPGRLDSTIDLLRGSVQ